MNLNSEIEHIKAEAIKNLLTYGKNKGYEKRLKPMSKEDFYDRNAISQKQIEENDLVSNQDAKAYFDRKHAQ